jgi:TolB-like protein/class 3 adenylate cyclase
MPQTRQLAAIMFTDIAGYTALMGRDEKKAFEILRKNREIQKPLIEKYHGRWIKELGDGVLASFHTVTDAVFCAASIHQAAQNVDGLKLRIGIHLGEVVFEDNDVFGDGVNIASRLQALASIGSTWVSEAVYKNLTNKKEISSEFIKEEHLKNVTEPVKVYEITVKEIPGHLQDDVNAFKTAPAAKVPAKKRNPVLLFSLILAIGIIASYFLFNNRSSDPGAGTTSEAKKVIAVLPFKLIGDDKEGKHIADGVADALINHLTGIKGLVVRSRTSVEQYADTKKNIQKIGEELKADYILEGSAQKYKDDIRIIVQLIDAKTDDHLWHNEYNKKFDNIFNVQSEIAQLISSSLQVTLSPKEKARIARIPTTNMDAWNIYLQAESKYVDWVYHNTGKKGYEEVMDLCNKAIALDPKLAEAYVTKSFIYFNANLLKQLQYENYMDSVVIWCNRALEANPNAAGPHVVMGYYSLNTGKDEEAKKYFEKARELAPNELFAYWGLANYYGKLSKREEEFINLKKTMELATQSVWLPGLYNRFAVFYLSICDFQKSLEFHDKSDNLGNTDIASRIWIYTCMGDKENARKAANRKDLDSINKVWGQCYYYMFFEPENALPYYYRLLKVEPEFALNPAAMHRFAYILWSSGNKEAGIKEFEKAQKAMLNTKNFGRNFWAIDYDLAGVFCFLGHKEKAMEYLRSYSAHTWHVGLPYYIDKDPLFNNLRNDPEFQKIVADAKEKVAKIRERIKQLDKEQLN